MTENQPAELRGLFKREWYCRAQLSYSGEGWCTPDNPHLSLVCSFRWIAPPLRDTPDVRRLLGQEPAEKEEVKDVQS